MHWIHALYLGLRLLSSGLALSVSVVTFRFVTGTARTSARISLGLFGAALLSVAGLLSFYDGVYNAILQSDREIALESWVWFALVDLTLPIYGWLLIGALRDRDRLVHRLQELSVTDPLTRAFNRRGFMDRAAAAIAQARRARQPAVIAVFDLDHFKAVNDTYGHDAGDFLLTTLVSVLQRELRDGDLIGRLGGDEFVALVFGSDMAQAAAAIDRVIAKIKTEIAPLAGGNGAGCSCGMAPVAHSGEPVTAVTQAVGLADAALYEAKRTGRDRIVLSNATLPDHQHQAAEGAASS